MFAIFQTGGKQYKVQVGDYIYVEKLDVNQGDEFKFTDVLMIDSKIGNPMIPGASVVGVIEKHGKQKKINVIKFKSKKHHFRKQGHRQPYTKVLIKAINTK